MDLKERSAAQDHFIDLTADDMARIAAAAGLDWSAVDPAIFGSGNFLYVALARLKDLEKEAAAIQDIAGLTRYAIAEGVIDGGVLLAII